MTYNIFKEKAKEAKAKFPGGRGFLPKVAGLRLSTENYNNIKEKIALSMELVSPYLVHNYLKIEASPYVPENVILCVDAKGTIIGVLKLGANDE